MRKLEEYQGCMKTDQAFKSFEMLLQKGIFEQINLTRGH
jgi:hypothetical protein